MTTRILRPEELARIADSDLGRALPWFPAGTRVLVCEDGATIVGHLALVPLLHVEGLEIAPAHRGKGVVFGKLIDAMHAEAIGMGARTVFPAAADEHMARLVTKLGAIEIPARWFALPVKES